MDILTALQVYKELADWYQRQGQSAMRDRFLILAAEAAFSSGNPEEAEHLRQRLLQGNPHHMLKPFNSFAQALQSTNVQIYIHDLQANYPPESAEELLQKLRSGVPPAPPAAKEGEAGPPTELRINPILEIRDESTRLSRATTEPLRVYPLPDEPLVKPKQPNRPAPRPPASTPARRGKGERPPPSDTAAPTGAWLPFILFGMTVTAGIALAFYTLARPFLLAP